MNISNKYYSVFQFLKEQANKYCAWFSSHMKFLFTSIKAFFKEFYENYKTQINKQADTLKKQGKNVKYILRRQPQNEFEKYEIESNDFNKCIEDLTKSKKINSILELLANSHNLILVKQTLLYQLFEVMHDQLYAISAFELLKILILSKSNHLTKKLIKKFFEICTVSKQSNLANYIYQLYEQTHLQDKKDTTSNVSDENTNQSIKEVQKSYQLTQTNVQTLYLFLTQYFLKMQIQFNHVDLAMNAFKKFFDNFQNLDENTSKNVFKMMDLLFRGYSFENTDEGFETLEELFCILDIMKIKPNEIFFNKIIDYTAKKNNLKVAELIFQEMVKNKVTPTIVTYNILLDSYFKHNHQEKALKLFEELQKMNISPDGFTYTTVIHGLKNAKSMNLHQIFALFDNYKTKYQPDQIIYNCVLDSCIQLNEMTKAQELVDQMKQENIQPDIVTYNTLIKGCCSQKNYEKGLEYFKEMKNSSVKPNQITFNSLIDMCVKCSQMNLAWQIYEEMTNAQIIPDNFTYSILINGIKSNNKNKQELLKALQFLEQIQSKNNFSPDEILYNSLMDACISFDESQKALNLYSEMLMKNVQPSNITYGILIKAYGKLNDLENAFKIYEELKAQKQQINDITYGCLLHACVKNNQLELALLLVEQMKIDNVELNTILYTTLIQGFTKAQKNEEALKVFELMKENKKSAPNLITYNQIINTCVKSNNLQKAMELFEEMQQTIKPDLITYSTIIKGFAKEQQFDLIDQYLTQMIQVSQFFKNLHFKQTNITPDDGLLNQVLEACHLNKEVNMAMKVFKLIKQLHLPTSEITFGIMMKIFCQNRQLNQAIHLLDIMKKQDILPNLIIYTTLISACFNARKIQKAMTFYEQMINNQIKLDGICYQQLIQGALKNNEIYLSIQFLREANENKKSLNTYIFKNLIEKIRACNSEDKQQQLEEVQLAQKVNYQFKKNNDFQCKQTQGPLFENTTYKNQQQQQQQQMQFKKDSYPKEQKKGNYKENFNNVFEKRNNFANSNTNNQTQNTNCSGRQQLGELRIQRNQQNYQQNDFNKENTTFIKPKENRAPFNQLENSRNYYQQQYN